jgi:hypothetical protein
MLPEIRALKHFPITVNVRLRSGELSPGIRTEIFKQCYWGDQVEEDENSGGCRMHGEVRNAYKIMAGKPDAKRPHERPRRKWEDI